MTEEDFSINRIYAPKVVREKILLLAEAVKARLEKPLRSLISHPLLGWSNLQVRRPPSKARTLIYLNSKQSTLNFRSAFQNSLGDTLLSLEESLPEIARLLYKQGYRNVDELLLCEYLQRRAVLSEEEMAACERYLSKGFHIHSLPSQAMSGTSTVNKLPICLYSKEKIVAATVEYLFQYHAHELFQAAK